jgi:hypothetical protein
MMMTAASTFETAVNLYHIICRYNLQDNHFHTRGRENRISYKIYHLVLRTLTQSILLALSSSSKHCYIIILIIATGQKQETEHFGSACKSLPTEIGDFHRAF